MLKNTTYTICISVLFLSVCNMLGCSRQVYHFYPGQPLPSQEVAFIYTHQNLHHHGCEISSMWDEKNGKEKKFFTPLFAFELLPGNYVATVECHNFLSSSYNYNTNTIRFEKYTSNINIAVESGNIYYIYRKVTKLPEKEIFTPVFVNLNDYNQEDCLKANGIKEINFWTGVLPCYEKEMILSGQKNIDRTLLTCHPENGYYANW